MIEEAIRNGTWVPPAASSSRRVDLSKKPKLYEAWISRGDAQDRRGLEHTDWEGIMVSDPDSSSYSWSTNEILCVGALTAQPRSWRSAYQPTISPLKIYVSTEPLDLTD